jgi:prepilin-type processing-associated H-X9-DG protein
MSGTRATLRNTGTPINQRRRLKQEIGSSQTYEPPADEAAAAAQAAAWLLHVGGFESYHPGGAQFAFGDGSVRFLSERISSTIYQRLGHRADGELVDDSAY